MKLKSTILFAIALTISVATHAQTPDPELPGLSWMAGYWTSDSGGNVTEELWTNGSGHMMLGLHRDVSSNGRSSFEYLRIMRTRDGIVYVATPNGRTSTIFPLKELGDQKVIFENPEHDFPQRIIYSRSGDKLTARIEGGEGEDMRHMEWTWTKTRPKF